jgi:hypothetical protein
MLARLLLMAGWLTLYDESVSSEVLNQCNMEVKGKW